MATGRGALGVGLHLEVVVGSTLHGVAVSDGLEDLDLMGVWIEASEHALGFSPKDCWVERTKPMGVRSESGDVDRVVYGLRKFLGLALKGNPSILLALFVPEEFRRVCTPTGAELMALAPKIVSKRAYKPFRGYMKQQHERLLGLRGQRCVTRPELVERHGYDTKYAAHIVRLGIQGDEIMRTGRITLPMPSPDREFVRDVRLGKYPLSDLSRLLLDSEQRLDVALAESPLPDAPETIAVERWMLDTYLWAWRDA